MNRIKIQRDDARDVLAADIVRQGRFGVAQIRAVAPLGHIREALRKQIRARGVSTMSGALEQRCERKVMELAGIGLLHTIAEAAAAPAEQRSQIKQRVARKCGQLIAMANSGQVASMGGWPAIAQAVQRKHAVTARALKARGASDASIAKHIQQLAAEDSAAIQHAISATEGEMSGFSLTNLARRAVSASQKLSPSHYLMRKVAPGLERLSPSHILSNKFTGGGGGGPQSVPGMPPGGMPASPLAQAFRGQSAAAAAQAAAQAEQAAQDAGPPQMDASNPMDYEMEAQDATQPPTDQPQGSYDQNDQNDYEEA